MATATRPSIVRSTIVGAILLGGLPLWMFPLFFIPIPGFLIYLYVSNSYYRLAQHVFGRTLFPVEEFGVIPHGAAGIATAAAFYAAIGAIGGCIVVIVRRALRSET